MPSGLTPALFIAKWSRVDLPERAASQEHFIDICRMLGQPTPAEHDATGAEYTFEKGVAVTSAASARSKGQRGFADVWWRGKFAWEYKRKDKYRDLAEAYCQLCQYREALENPPLLIVSDIGRIEIHTNFTGTRKEVHALALTELDQPESLDKLRRVFTEPRSFEPQLTIAKITEEAAAQFAKIANGLRDRGHDPHVAAHFLMKCMFCLFAEDVGLLPNGLMKRLLKGHHYTPEKLTPRLTELFTVMRTRGYFGADEIAYFNGGLFDVVAQAGEDACATSRPAGRLPGALELRAGEIGAMLTAAEHDWGSVEPAIFGTLFERSLDPSKGPDRRALHQPRRHHADRRAGRHGPAAARVATALNRTPLDRFTAVTDCQTLWHRCEPRFGSYGRSIRTSQAAAYGRSALRGRTRFCNRRVHSRRADAFRRHGRQGRRNVCRA